MKHNILIITGEPSGDMRGGELLAELKKLAPDTSFWGIGGENMEGQGVELIEHIKDLSVVGVLEAAKKLPEIRKQYNNVTENIRRRRPSLAILIDYPGFTLEVAAFLRRRKIPVIYYVIPQVWAWGKWRIKALKRYVSKALVLFKFEEKLLRDHGIDCQFVGHPLMDHISENHESRTTNHELTISLLPGSRKTEVTSMLPVMLAAAEKIGRTRGNVNFVIAESSNVSVKIYDSIIQNHTALSIRRVKNDTPEAISKCDFAVVTSGTATLETAIMEKPMIIVYHVSWLTYFISRFFAIIPFLGLVNIIAGKQIVPELLQGDFTPEKVSNKVLEIINNDAAMRRMKDELKNVKLALGKKGASRRAAEAISAFIREN